MSRLALLILFASVLASCSRLRPEEPPADRKSPLSLETAKERWNAIPVASAAKAEACGLRIEDVASEGGGNTYIRVTAAGAACDPLSDALRPVTLHRVHLLASARPTSIIRVDVSPSQHRGALRSWAAFLLDSPEWRKRPRMKNRWNESEYELISRLLKASDPFADYGRPLADLGYDLDSVAVEKVDYAKLKERPEVMTAVTGLGYRPDDVVPVPLILRLIFARRAS